jgi:hypothetical protein
MRSISSHLRTSCGARGRSRDGDRGTRTLHGGRGRERESQRERVRETWTKMRWNADFSVLRSLNWIAPTCPSSCSVSCAASDCRHDRSDKAAPAQSHMCTRGAAIKVAAAQRRTRSGPQALGASEQGWHARRSRRRRQPRLPPTGLGRCFGRGSGDGEGRSAAWMKNWTRDMSSERNCDMVPELLFAKRPVDEGER